MIGTQRVRPWDGPGTIGFFVEKKFPPKKTVFPSQVTEIINILNLKKKYDSILLETVREKVKKNKILGGGVWDSPETIVKS